MNLADYIAAYRSITQDEGEGVFWNDSEIIAYANRAENEAARRALLIADTGILNVFASDPLVSLAPMILLVRRVRLVTGQKNLAIKGWREVEEMEPHWEDQTGAPRVAIPDWITGALRLSPTPTANDTIRANYFRLPRKEMTAMEDRPEIPLAHHQGLLDHMLELGYSKHDADRFDPDAAAYYGGRFTATFGPAASAVSETLAQRDVARDRHSAPR